MSGPNEIVARLARQFGYGEFPLVRKRLYSRLGRLVDRYGDRALAIITEVWQAAVVLRDRETGKPASADSQARWFCFSVTRRLQEDELTLDAGPRTADEMAAGQRQRDGAALTRGVAGDEGRAAF